MVKKLTEDEKKKLAEDDYSDVEVGAEEYANTVLKKKKDKESAKTLEEFEDIIQSEQDFLKFCDEFNENISLVYRNKLFKFKIRPVEPGDDLSFLSSDTTSFMDMKPEERKAMRKELMGKPLSDKEQELVDAVNRRSRKDVARKGMEAINKLVETFVISPNLTPKDWSKIPLNLRLFLGNELMDKLGLSFGEAIHLFHDNG